MEGILRLKRQEALEDRLLRGMDTVAMPSNRFDGHASCVPKSSASSESVKKIMHA